MNKKDKLNIVRKLAKLQNIEGDIYLSDKKNKKFVLVYNNKKIYFGSPEYDDFLDHQNEMRRLNYHKRFSKVKNYNTPYTPNYLSSRLLW